MKRHVYLDKLRTAACLAVIMIHVCGAIVGGSEVISRPTGLYYHMANILMMMSRFAVPIFIMISGSIFLDEEYDCDKRKLKRHIVKFLKIFAFWSVVYCLLFHIAKPALIGGKITIGECIMSLLTGGYHMWYIYLLIGLYLITPLLRLWINKKNIKFVKYYLVISICFTFLIPTILSVTNMLPMSSDVASFVGSIAPGYIGGYATYYILGWYLSNIDIKNTKKIYLLGLVSIAIAIATSVLLNAIYHVGYDWANRALSVHIMLYSAAIFIYAKKCLSKNMDGSVIKSISNNSLGIYLLHPLLLGGFEYVFGKYINLPVVLYIPLGFIFATITTYLCVVIMKKTPFIRRFVA